MSADPEYLKICSKTANSTHGGAGGSRRAFDQHSLKKKQKQNNNRMFDSLSSFEAADLKNYTDFSSLFLKMLNFWCNFHSTAITSLTGSITAGSPFSPFWPKAPPAPATYRHRASTEATLSPPQLFSGEQSRRGDVCAAADFDGRTTTCVKLRLLLVRQRQNEWKETKQRELNVSCCRDRTCTPDARTGSSVQGGGPMEKHHHR